MTSGVTTDEPRRPLPGILRILQWIGILPGLVFTTTLAGAAERWDVDALMAALSRVEGGEKRFTEIKTMALLKEPMRLKAAP